VLDLFVGAPVALLHVLGAVTVLATPAAVVLCCLIRSRTVQRVHQTWADVERCRIAERMVKQNGVALPDVLHALRGKDPAGLPVLNSADVSAPPKPVRARHVHPDKTAQTRASRGRGRRKSPPRR
jgi:hypothetical protein